MKIFTSYLETHPGSLAGCEAIVKKFWRNIVFSPGREELISSQICCSQDANELYRRRYPSKYPEDWKRRFE
jgi:hypothetical protein